MKAEATHADKDDDSIHAPSGHTLWSESWYFDFVSADASSGGFVRFGAYPAQGVAWWWVHLVATPGDPSGAAGCQLERPVPPEVGMPLRLDNPAVAIELAPAEAGRRWHLAVEAPAFALDLHWWADAGVYRYQQGSRCEQPGWASGTLRVGGHHRAVDGPAQRDHSWGIRDWWRFPWDWCAGWLVGGQRFQATRLESRGRVPVDGYLLQPGGVPAAVTQVEFGRRSGRGVAGTVRLDAGQLEVVELAFVDLATVPIDLAGPGDRVSRLDRSMVALHGPDGRRGVGWCERNQPYRRPS